MSILFFLYFPVNMIDLNRTSFHMIGFPKCGMGKTCTFQFLQNTVSASYRNVEVFGKLIAGQIAMSD